MAARTDNGFDNAPRDSCLLQMSCDPLVSPAVERATVFGVKHGVALIAQITVGDKLNHDLSGQRLFHTVALKPSKNLRFGAFTAAEELESPVQRLSESPIAVLSPVRQGIRQLQPQQQATAA